MANQLRPDGTSFRNGAGGRRGVRAGDEETPAIGRGAEGPHPGRLHGGGQMTGDAQALSDRHKEAVRSWAPRVRKTLEEDFAAQLERLGMQPNGRHTPLDTMRLPDETKAIRRRVEALLAREVKAEGSAERGFDNVLRELTYTLLNRLVGLKAMEARGLLFLPPPGVTDAPPEPTEVIGPVPGQPRSRYLRDFRAASGRRYKYADDADSGPAARRPDRRLPPRHPRHPRALRSGPRVRLHLADPRRPRRGGPADQRRAARPAPAARRTSWAGSTSSSTAKRRSASATRTRARPARPTSSPSSTSSTPRRGS